jgi:hydrogenase maturation protease
MGDDAVGIQVIRILRERLQSRSNLDFKELSVGGLRLVEEMRGYDEVLVVDSIESNSQVGQIREFSPGQFKDAEQTTTPHDINLPTAFSLYNRLEPNMMPGKVRIFTISIRSDLTFHEGLSPPVQEAALKLADIICHEIE